MPVAAFDIDGTLTATVEVGVDCYEAAVHAELGVRIPADWPSFDETDASSLLRHLHRFTS